MTFSGSASLNGVTVSSIAVDSMGNVRATVAATCTATNASFTLKVTDDASATDTDTLTVTVTPENVPPTITPKAAVSLSPANHKYVTLNLAAMVAAVSDNCSSLTINDVVISSVSSDEPENANGNGDGNTVDNIVIAANCKSVQLRAERADALNGRVYTVTLKVKDAAGNIGMATFRVNVPISGGGTATDSGVSYTVTGCTP